MERGREQATNRTKRNKRKTKTPASPCSCLKSAQFVDIRPLRAAPHPGRHQQKPQPSKLLSRRAIVRSLDLILNGIRIRRVITPHPLQLIADITCYPRVHLRLLPQVLLRQVTDGILPSQGEVIVVVAVRVIAVAASGAEAEVAVGGGAAEGPGTALFGLGPDVVEVVGGGCGRGARCLGEAAVDAGVVELVGTEI
jgi:hypothetical protein